MRKICFIALLVFAPMPALADSKVDLAKIESVYKKCMDTEPSNAGMKQYTWAAYEAADKVLNVTYQRVNKDWATGTDPDSAERKKRLLGAQRAWLAFRDAQCLLEAASMLGGTGEGLVEGGCLYDKTKARVKELEDVLVN